jgi:hypothetical protein
MMKNVIALGLILLSSVAYAATETLEWTPPEFYIDGMALDPATEIISYTLYYGQESGTYSQQVTITPDAREHTIIGLSGTWVFAMTATSVELEESAYSNEISRKFTKGKPRSFTIRFRSRN